MPGQQATIAQFHGCPRRDRPLFHRNRVAMRKTKQHFTQQLQERRLARLVCAIDECQPAITKTELASREDAEVFHFEMNKAHGLSAGLRVRVHPVGLTNQPASSPYASTTAAVVLDHAG